MCRPSSLLWWSSLGERAKATSPLGLRWPKNCVNAASAGSAQPGRGSVAGCRLNCVFHDRPRQQLGARMKKIFVVLGTRPEVIKLAPVVRRLQRSRVLQPVICAHPSTLPMLDQMMRVFGLHPDLLPGHHERTPVAGRHQCSERSRRASAADLDSVRPACVLVQGDTTTTFASSTLAVAHADVPVAHVEAGLRTDDKRHPFPEEINRRLTTQLADFHFAPPPSAPVTTCCARAFRAGVCR